MNNKEIEMRYSQMKSSWNHIVNTNIELVDDNKMLKEENDRLNNNIENAIKILEYYNSGEVLYYVPIQEIIDTLKGSNDNE